MFDSRRPPVLIDELAFTAEDLGAAKFMANRPGHRLVYLKDAPRLAGFFGLNDRFEDSDGVVHETCVVTNVTYRELVEKA